LVRAGRVLWRLLPWLVVGGALLAGAWLFGATPAFKERAVVVAAFLVGFALVQAVTAEILSPNRPALRLVPISDQRARYLSATIRVLLVLFFITEVGRWFVEATGWHKSVASLLLLVRNIGLVLLAAAVIASTGVTKWLKGLSPDTYRGLIGRVTGRILLPFAFLAALYLVVAYALGYVPLADFVAWHVVQTFVQILVAVVVFRYARRALKRSVAFIREGGRSRAATGEPDTVAIGLERIGGGILKILVSVAALFWILAGWGLGPGEGLRRLDDPIFAGAALTWGESLRGVARVLAVLVLGWFLKNLLTFFVFPRSNVEVGARYAILAILRYLVIIFAVVFGLEAVGLSTSSLGWFMGAAGIGLGFGLRDILGNFFSGLIMLLERPIRVGDMIQVGDAAGTVEDIRMRGTAIRTWDNTRVLIPNQQMLGERVTNLSYKLGHSRITVNVGVGYDEDPHRVREILLEVARSHEDVMSDPAPVVRFQNFGNSSLDFTLLCHTTNVTSRVSIASDLRYRIFERFRKEEIEIPFPQQDIHIKDLPPGAR
jgi:small-conductance mechanosensitive channel